jgi:phosphoribosylformylglycinamidine synthase
MALGNEIGFAFEEAVPDETIFGYRYGAFVVELSEEAADCGILLGHTTAEADITRGGEVIPLAELLSLYEGKLESVYPTHPHEESAAAVPVFSAPAVTRVAPAVALARPRALIPVFPGTNCEYDTRRAFEEAGAEGEIFVIRNRTAADIAASVEEFAARVDAAQMIFLPGGFSGGDEPDGSGKFITAFFRNAAVREAVHALLDERDGLMAGICNGFQALIKLGLVPYGKILNADASFPTLTFNTIGRHQSRLVQTRIASNRSPWLAETKVGDVYTVPISHGEGRFYASDALIASLAENGQIATQYADLSGDPTMDILFNPNGSACAIEGITSPDGRVLGKMGHSERVGDGLYRNVPGRFEMGMFTSAVRYFKKV